ncbi:Rad52/22 family double-strand break repair protein-domain-containing protein [Syncephalastrum racemosum]|uniref:Rad52/22 family double-strand break repair protein-domain-containing protein n=1 Tax=Syncephalastrum racemosum TaxID=13706 RepID=A0A1X2H3R9_SYNRA|nr:Rad52/22 family double-strand break repair protein-domain-containing protein [Syncephalastrum racemosum]
MDPSKIFTDEERLYLNSELGKGIGPEFIAYRAGPAGHRFTYIEGKTVIQLLNKFFGFNGWKTEIRGTTVDFCDITPNGQISVGVSAIVRVTLKDGTYHEDIGYGSLENGKSKAAAFEKAKKEAVTDAMKRAARMFGDAVGNCLYDKRFLQGIQNMKAPPVSRASGCRNTEALTQIHILSI